jgi:hypothetical protein
MGVVWLRWRAEVRAKWRTTVVLTLLVGIGGGVALTAIAGARRADTAMPRFVAYTLPDDGSVLFGSNPFSPPPVHGSAAYSLAPPPYAQRVVRLPQVATYFRKLYLFMVPGRARGSSLGSLNVFGAADASMFRGVDRPVIVAGRLPDPANPVQVAVNELAAEKGHLRVGSSLRLSAYSASQVRNGGLTAGISGGATRQQPAGPSFIVRVAAIIRLPSDVSAIGPIIAKQDVSYEGQENLYTTPAFLKRLATGLGIPVQQMPVMGFYSFRLRHGAADWNAFAAAVSGQAHAQAGAQQLGDVFGTDSAASSAERGIRLEVVALLVFGVLALLVTLLLVGQALARQVMLEGNDYATLRSLGATRAQVLGIVLLRAIVIGGVGGALAFVVAVLASPIMPIGLARQAEIHPGFDVNLSILVSGMVVVALLMVARAVVPAWSVSRRTALHVGDDNRASRPSRVVAALSRTSASPSAVIGVRFGLEAGRGRSSVPGATAMVGAVAAVAALAAALTFATSLGHLVDSPRQQGWNWDVLVGNPNDTSDREAQAGALLARNPLVGSYSAIAMIGSVTIDGAAVPAIAVDPLEGSVYPPLLEGRAPRAANEIVLGTGSLKEIHKRVGQAVQVATPAGSMTLRVVGRMISPSVGDLFTNGLGQGGWVSGRLLRQIEAHAPTAANGPPPVVFTLFAIRYAPGASAHAAFASLRRDFGATVLRQLPAEDAIDLQSVDGLPFVLSGLVVLLGAASIGNTLVTFVRRRQRDLAILKTLGFVRRQVSSTVAWQATSFAVVALLVGLPVGVAGGRWAWSLVASNIGSVSPPLVPALAIALVVPAALAVANAIAAVPGWAAGRVAPALVMRSE